MISRPCRISLQRPRFLLEAFPIHRLATSSAIAVATSPPYSIDVPHLTFKTSIIALTPRPMSKSSRGSALPSQRHPSLRLIGRLLLINNTNTNFSSKTPSPPRVQYHHSPLAYLRRFFRPQSKLQLSYPQFFLSHSKSPRGTRISSSNDNLPARSRGGAASQTPISRVFGVGKTAMHIWYSPHISRADESSILHDAADRWSHDLLAVFLPIREISHSSWNHTKKCAVHCDSATIAQ